MDYRSAYSDNKSDSRDSGLGGTTPTANSYNTGETYKTSELYKTVDDYNRPVSPPMPPVRDASSLHYNKVPQNHEKYPSWPVTQATSVITPTGIGASQGAGISSRTKSWSDTSHAASEFPNKPRMAYQPHLNTHVEERMSPQTMRRYLQENRLKSPKEKFDERVATELKGEDLDLRKSFPLDGKGKIDVSSIKGSDPSYPLPNLDRDGRYMEDKNYAIPSPPQRDISPTRNSDNRGFHSGTYSHQHQLATSADQTYVGQSTPPPPLPDNSPPHKPPHVSVGSHMTDTGVHSGLLNSYSTPNVQTVPHSHDNKTSPSPQSMHYPYVIRQRAFYNTSTQTDSKNASVQVENIPSKSVAKIRREEKSVQARPGSIISHFENQQAKTQQEADNDYERLIFHRGSDHSHSVATGTSTDAGTSPGPYSPHDHRIPPIVDHMEHRIPDIIRENNEPSSLTCQKTIQEDVLAQIQGHSESETVMLRRLSQDFFIILRSRVGV
jgi:hypothetical protein